MSEKFQIGRRTYTDDVDPAIYGCGKSVSKSFEIQKGQVLKDVASLKEISTPIIDLLSSDDENAAFEDTSLHQCLKPSAVDNLAKSNSKNLQLQYRAYREKHASLSKIERNGRAQNLQEFIWSKSKSTGEYNYDSDDPRDMKLKRISEQIKLRHKDNFEKMGESNCEVTFLNQID